MADAPHLFVVNPSTAPHVVPGAIRLVGQVLPLPETLVLDAGHGDGLDIVRTCSRHQWASLRVPLEPNVTRPTCPLCEVERLEWDGFARYRDLSARKEAGSLR